MTKSGDLLCVSSGTLDLLQLPIFIISKAFGFNFSNFLKKNLAPYTGSEASLK